MREAINSNPRVQIGLFLGGLLIMVFMLMRGMGGGEEEIPPPDPAPGSAGTTVPGAAVPATGTTTAPVALVPGVPAAPPPTAPVPTGEPVSLETGPGLPARFADAYNDGEAIAILIRSRRSHADRAIDSYAEAAIGDRAELIVINDSRVSDYASVIGGLNVNRTPALVVIRPSELSGGAPVGDVLYGFRDERSLRQGVEDALYDGPSRKYAP